MSRLIDSTEGKMNSTLPKELTLLQPARYNEEKFQSHLKATLTIVSFQSMYEKENRLFNTFFATDEHKELAYDIIKFIIDREPNIPKTLMIKKFVLALYEAGYFG
jgi:hypothetical protein